MQIARLWNQHGAYCREWTGENLTCQYISGCINLSDGDKVVAFMILNGHSLVMEEYVEAEEAKDKTP